MGEVAADFDVIQNIVPNLKRTKRGEYVERRVSPRLQELESRRSNMKLDKTTGQCGAECISPEKGKDHDAHPINGALISNGLERVVSADFDVEIFDTQGTPDSCALTLPVEKNAHARVKETLKTFNSLYLQLVKGKKAHMGVVKHYPKRPDLQAITQMMKANAILYPRKVGALEGIDVGHHFFSRAEMVVVGLHGSWLRGIDFMGDSYRKMDGYRYCTFPLAVSIVMFADSKDDLSDLQELVYTGQGGLDLSGKRRIRDQELSDGNLALKNSMDQNVPVRVSRGHASDESYVGKVYVYEGLYKIVKYWDEKGPSGFTVFKFQLRRLAGQPSLTNIQMPFYQTTIQQSLFELDGLVCKDISAGQEKIPIPATNTVDDPPCPPIGYKYSKVIVIKKNVKAPSAAKGCNCRGSCVDPKMCSCARLNGSDFPYVEDDGGRLYRARAVVFECGPNCGCGPHCINRISQHGLRYRLEVFKTRDKGWAVRSWDPIPSGAPVCEYTGILTKSDELDNITENDFVFEIDCLQTMKGLEGRERRRGSVQASIHLGSNKAKTCGMAPEFCIDAGPVGNVARFINHSCEPNLFVQCVLSAHHDVKQARVFLFAADSIPPLQELTYDYGYPLDSVVGPDGTIKQMPCYCGTSDCRKRLY